MKYDFDRIIDRSGTDAIKYDIKGHGMTEGVIPLWVADMEFRAPECVVQAMKERCDHGIFGYTGVSKGYKKALLNWTERRFGWSFEDDWLICTPGVVNAISTAIRALSQRGDAILIQEPVYYPFRKTIELNDRKLCVNQMKYDGRSYIIDFDDFEDKIKNESVKIFILCSPHNPVGRVWSEAELMRMGEICFKYGVIIIADEIHADFVFTPAKHLMFPGLDSRFEDITVLCTAPSKTFNLAALQTSNIFIPNEKLRESFTSEMSRCGCEEANGLGLTAVRAAYEGGEEWLEELLVYLKGNLELVERYLVDNLSSPRLVKPQGTYLLWLDFGGLGLDEKGLDELMIDKAGLWLSAGTTFGSGGSGFRRLNMACPRSTLHTALDRLASAVKSLDRH